MSVWKSMILMLALCAVSSCRMGSNKANGRVPAVNDPKCSAKSQTDCESNPNCQMNNGVCSGSYNFCSGFTTEKVCPSGSCSWSDTNQSCSVIQGQVNQQNTPSCSQNSQATCASVAGCMWDGTSCVDATITPPTSNCSSFMTQATCPMATCTWTGTICASCSMFTTQSACGIVDGCSWNGSICMRNTTQTPAPQPTPNPNPPTQGSYCTPLNTSALCAAAPGCVWDGITCKLFGSGRAPQPTKCSPFDSEAMCRAGVGCQWISSRCLRPSVGLGTPFEKGDGLSSEGSSSNQLSNCSFSAIIQADGNFVINRGTGSPIWSAKTAGKGFRTVFQPDGNLVVLNAANSVVWSTGTANKGAQGLLLTNNGNLIVVSIANTILWQSNSAVGGCN